MSNCNGDCSSCSTKGECSTAKLKTNENNRIKKVIAVVSGKGGVGKSLTTASLAIATSRRGLNAAVLDADITGASIPQIFGLSGDVMGDGKLIYPAISRGGVKVMSINLLLESPDSPVIWRGSLLSNCLKQFWQDVLWEDVDYMFIDMPPGTGDIPLTVFQSLPIDGIVIVTTPQDMVSMIVKKAYHMAVMMDVPIIGLIENFSYMNCPDCGKVFYPFGEGKAEAVAKDMGSTVLTKMPINNIFADACDKGLLEETNLLGYETAADNIIEFFNKK